MNAKWLLKNGATVMECTSFPYAYRTAFNLIRKAIEAKQDPSPLIKGISIVSPHKDSYGNMKTYLYAEATQMAEGMGLLTPDGSINSREFRRR